MSVKVMSQVWEWSKAEGTDLLVMLALADFCDDHGVCFPGIDRIAKKVRVSERSVQRIIAKQIELGEIQKELGAGLLINNSHGGPGYTNAYRLILRGDRLSPSNGLRGDTHGSCGVTNGVSAIIRESSERTVSGRFAPPSIEEVRKYSLELGHKESVGEAFYEYNQSRGWKVGRVGMKDWKAALRFWVGHEKKNDKPKDHFQIG